MKYTTTLPVSVGGMPAERALLFPFDYPLLKPGEYKPGRVRAEFSLPLTDQGPMPGPGPMPGGTLHPASAMSAIAIVAAFYCNCQEIGLALSRAGKETLFFTISMDPDLRIRDLCEAIDSCPTHGCYTTRWNDTHIELTLTAGLGVLEIECTYNSLVISEQKAGRFVSHIRYLIQRLPGALDQRIADCGITTEAETAELLDQFRRSLHAPLARTNFWRNLQRYATEDPARHALRFKSQVVTYEQLYEKITVHCERLHARGIVAGDRAILLLDRGPDQIINMLALLQLGCAFVPVSTDAPLEQVSAIIGSVRPVLIVTDQWSLLPVLEGQPVLLLGKETQTWPGQRVRKFVAPNGVTVAGEPAADTASPYPVSPYPCGRHRWNPDPLGDQDLAYIMFTSGTTGPPKGIEIAYKSLMAYIDIFSSELAMQADDVVLQQFPYIFDGFLEEVFPILQAGGTVAMADREVVQSPARLASFIRRHRVTLVSCTPLLLSQLNRLGSPLSLSSVRAFVSGGDVLKKEHINHLLSVADIYNTYGPTQTTVSATIHKCTAKDPVLVPAGRPLPLYGIVILNEQGQLAPKGVFGEICIAGVGLALGYIAESGFTRQKFPEWQPPAASAPERADGQAIRIFRTADVGRWREDGLLEFGGRMPAQKNIVGLQIFNGNLGALLAQTEYLLSSYPGIKAVTALLTETPGNSRAPVVHCYYIAGDAQDNGLKEEYGNALKESFGDASTKEDYTASMEYFLAKYLTLGLPLQFTCVDAFPQDRNGKLCRKSLRTMQCSQHAGEKMQPSDLELTV